MTSSLNLFEQALQAPTMEAVIALSERVQTLETKPEGVVYTAYRAIDQTLLIGIHRSPLSNNHRTSATGL